MKNVNQPNTHQQQTDKKSSILRNIRYMAFIVENNADKIAMVSNKIIHADYSTTLNEEQLQEIYDGLKKIYDIIQPLRYTLADSTLRSTDNPPVYIVEVDDDPERWEK